MDNYAMDLRHANENKTGNSLRFLSLLLYYLWLNKTGVRTDLQPVLRVPIPGAL